MMTRDNSAITAFVSQDIVENLPGLVELLEACILDGASIGFIVPLPPQASRRFWLGKVLPAVAEGSRLLLVARQDGQIAGTVQLDYDTPDNQRHRAEIRKLLVHPRFRRQGIARELMAEVEDRARNLGRNLLTLDTRTGDAAEPLYRSIGFQTVGTIPRFCRDTLEDRLDPTTIMYKDL